MKRSSPYLKRLGYFGIIYRFFAPFQMRNSTGASVVDTKHHPKFVLVHTFLQKVKFIEKKNRKFIYFFYLFLFGIGKKTKIIHQKQFSSKGFELPLFLPLSECTIIHSATPQFSIIFHQIYKPLFFPDFQF